VVIVGGGIIGCSTAYNLVKLGHQNVTVIEAVEIAHAASGRAGGFLALDWCDGQATSELARRSYRLHSQLSTELGFDCGYREMNTLSMEITSERKNETKNAPSWIDGGVKQSSVIGTTQTTAQVHPRLLTSAFMTKAESLGAKIVRDAVIEGVMEENVVTGVKTRGGLYLSANIVVLCMGPWSNQGLRWFGATKKIIDGSRAHSIVMKLNNDSSNIDNTALFLSNKNSPEVYPRPDGTVYMCGGCTSSEMPLPHDPACVEVDDNACEQIKKMAGKVSDELRQVTEYTRSACYLPHSADGVPVIGHVPQVPGLMIAAGHSCWGILQAPATGEAMAELIIHGRASNVDLKPFSPGRFFN